MLLLCQLLLPCGLITGDQRAAFMYVCTPMYELRGVLVAQLMVQKFSHWGDTVSHCGDMVVVRDAC